ncbi:exonuclease domain-containing protein [Virgibacillus halophilus]|uniref:Exonuclease domain-containing protein n=1 Tax=Tigheibacillus halophilus TaxID=361280 RepID=A0ABU5CE13_9BACI|nr:exonuclease domain-containing protein [Virgibacillus halophilus]
MHFIAIDFELANSWNRSSACSVGLVELRNERVVNEYYSLINPKDEFDYFCMDIHGITPEMVENEPTFDEIWPELETFLNNNLVVAHNASFDMSVLRHCLNENALQFPALNYVCSYLLSKKNIFRAA